MICLISLERAKRNPAKWRNRAHNHMKVLHAINSPRKRLNKQPENKEGYGTELVTHEGKSKD